MAEVVGRGERRHPPGGNALLTTRDANGKRVETFLWLSQFATDLNLQIDSAQLRRGLSHRPIRLLERTLVFSTLWNVKDRPKYVKLLESIREHWAYNLNEARPTSMALQYYGANKTWRGFIENGSIGYAVTDVVLTYQFQMRLIPSVSTDISEMAGRDAPYAPTSQDVHEFGNGWYDMGDFFAEFVGEGNELESGKTNRGNTDPTDTSGGRRG